MARTIKLKNEVISSGDFKSSFRLSWYDKKGSPTNGLFANKRQAQGWCKRTKLKKCGRIK